MSQASVADAIAALRSGRVVRITGENPVAVASIETLTNEQLESLDPKLQPKDVDGVDVRTNPLGPLEDAYPIDDYEVPMPETEDVTDVIRIERLGFEPAKKQSSNQSDSMVPMTFDAAIYFACGGESWPMKLKYDVDFITAFPCHAGPHGNVLPLARCPAVADWT